MLSGRSILTVPLRQLSLLYSSLLLGLWIQNRQLCPSIAPGRNLKTETHTDTQLQVAAHDDAIGQRADDHTYTLTERERERILNRCRRLACCWCAIFTQQAPKLVNNAARNYRGLRLRSGEDAELSDCGDAGSPHGRPRKSAAAWARKLKRSGLPS